MQTNLRSLFAGKREVVEVPPKRGPGRPPKVRKREEEDEQPDAIVEALQDMPDQPEAYDEHLRVRHRKRKAESMEGGEVPGSSCLALVEAAGVSVAELRMPGNIERSSKHEGPQVKLRLCKWFEKTLEGLGGSDETHELLLGAVAEKWGVPRFEIVRILRNKAKWEAQCEERGVTSKGLRRDEVQLPQFLRKSMRGKGEVRRAKGGGRKDRLRFLYPCVRDFFELMRVHGKYIDAEDLEEYLQHSMQRYLDEAEKPEVAASIEAGSRGEGRIEFVKEELRRLRDPKTSKRTHEHRQGQLMRFCGARLRTPQRLTTLSLGEERGRWMSTLQAYDRLLWEAMRPEHLRKRVVDPEKFAEEIEDCVVIHADQVPCWLSTGMLRQLYGNAEVKRRKKKHEEAVPRLSEPGQQV